MSTGNDLLRAISANPDDDALRLVYADWLEEQGDEARARYVRVEVAIAQQGGPDHCPVNLWRESVSLWQRHARSWKAELPPWARSEPKWDRGVVHQVSITSRNFLRHGKRLDHHLPGVRTIGIILAEDQWPALVSHPTLPRLRGLSVEGAEAWRHLSGMTLPSLEEFRLDGLREPLSDLSLGAERSERWPRLRSLCLRQVGLPLLDLAPLTELRSLRFEYVGFEPSTGVTTLPPGLQQLELCSTNHCTRPILRSVHFDTVRDLRLIQAVWDADDLIPLQRDWPTLETLQISNSGISVGELLPLFEADRLPALRDLNLDNVGCTEADFLQLVETPVFARLRRLSMVFVAELEAGLLRWLSSPSCERLESLAFSFTRPCEALARAMRDSPHLGRLHRLRVLASDFGGEAITILGERFEV